MTLHPTRPERSLVLTRLRLEGGGEPGSDPFGESRAASHPNLADAVLRSRIFPAVTRREWPKRPTSNTPPNRPNRVETVNTDSEKATICSAAIPYPLRSRRETPSRRPRPDTLTGGIVAIIITLRIHPIVTNETPARCCLGPDRVDGRAGRVGRV